MIYLIIGDKQFSSWSMRASIILKEKNIPYTEVLASLDWPIKFSDKGTVIPINKKEEYDLPKEPASGCGCQLTQLLKIDPSKKLKGSIVESLPRVPILIDTNTEVVICDVLAINEYLEETYKEFDSLLSEDLIKRSDIRVFSSHIHADLLPLMSGISYSHSFRKPDFASHEQDEETTSQIQETLTLLENTLKRKKEKGWKGDFLFGDFSLADAMFAPIAQQFKGWKIEIKNLFVSVYLENLLNRESIFHYLKEANNPYELLAGAEVGSPSWIAFHYRYLSEFGMIHNINTSVYHILNEHGKLLYELAKNNSSFEEMIAYVINEYDIDSCEASRDILEFFETIHPSNIVENDFLELTLS